MYKDRPNNAAKGYVVGSYFTTRTLIEEFDDVRGEFEAITGDSYLLPTFKEQKEKFTTYDDETRAALNDLFSFITPVSISGPPKRFCYKYTISEGEPRLASDAVATEFEPYTALSPIVFDEFSGSFEVQTSMPSADIAGNVVDYKICAEPIVVLDDPGFCWIHSIKYPAMMPY